MLCSRVKNASVAVLSVGSDVLITPFGISPALATPFGISPTADVGGGGVLTTPFGISPAKTEHASIITSTDTRRVFFIVLFPYEIY
jgi:hypothetical protein